MELTTMRTTVSTIIVLAAGLLLAGCEFGVGSPDFACPGMPNGVQCKSAREVYQLTNHHDAVSSMDGSAERAIAADQGKDAALPTAKVAAASDDVPYPVVYSDNGDLPVRAPARVMRIWIAPFE